MFAGGLMWYLLRFYSFNFCFICALFALGFGYFVVTAVLGGFWLFVVIRVGVVWID